MAKNVFLKKKRITHVGNVVGKNYVEGKSLSSGCIDYVSSIIQDMDLDFQKSVSFGNTHKERQNFKVDIQNTKSGVLESSAVSNGQNLKSANSKIKKFSIVRKFPLMEKSQKILKHIKHNRKIPKPRAHMSSLPKLPVKQPVSGVSRLPRKENSPLEKKNSSYDMETISGSNLKRNDKNKPSKDGGKMLEMKKRLVSKKTSCVSSSVCSNDPVNSTSFVKHCKNNHETCVKSALEDNGETTDSEYERFLQSAKTERSGRSCKGTKRKIIRKKKVPKKLKKVTNASSERVDIDNESDLDNRNMTKKQKVRGLELVSKKLLNKQSETNESSLDYSSDCSAIKDSGNLSVCSSSEHDENLNYAAQIPNEIGCDPSYSSDESVCTDITNKCYEAPNKQYNMCSINDNSDGIQSSVVVINENVSTNSLQNELEHGKDQSSHLIPAPVSTILSNFSDSVSKSIELAVDNSAIIDLCSDTEPENFDPAQPTLENENICITNKGKLDIMSNSIDSEDSDLEIIEVISPNVTNVNSNKMMGSVFKDSTFSSSKKSFCPEKPFKNIEHLLESDKYVSSCEPYEKIHVKTENDTNKHDAVYSTNICKDISENRLTDICDLNYLQVKNNTSNSATDICHQYPENTHVINTISEKSMFRENCSDKNIKQVMLGKKTAEQDHVKAGICVDNTCINACIYKKVQHTSKQFCNIMESGKSFKIKNEITETTTRSRAKSCTNNTINLSLENVVKKEVLDDDIIIIDDSEPQEKNMSETNTMHGGDFSDMLKHKAVQQNVYMKSKADQNSEKKEEQTINSFNTNENSDIDKCLNQVIYVQKCNISERNIINIDSNLHVKKESPSDLLSLTEKDFVQHELKFGSFQNNEVIKKELNLFDSIFPDSNIFESKTFHELVDNFKSKLSKSYINKTDIIHLVELYKNEFRNYQQILKTEQHVEAGLKLVEARQADKLKDIRCLIQKLLKSDSSFGKVCDMDTKEQENLSCKTMSLSNLEKSSNSVDVSKKLTEGYSGIALSSGSSPDSSTLLSNTNTKIKYDTSTSSLSQLPISLIQNAPLIPKTEVTQSSQSYYEDQTNIAFSHGLQSEKKQTLKLLGKLCNVCGKEAIAACQRCAKAFFCSDRCGKIFWSQGHEKICG